MTKRSFIICGTESTGTKITGQIFEKCFGCKNIALGTYYYGNNNNTVNSILSNSELCSMNISMPFNNPPIFLDPVDIANDFINRGSDQVDIIITMRSWNYQIQSQIKHMAEAGYKDVPESSLDYRLNHIKNGYDTIFKTLPNSNFKYIFSPYESLIHYGEDHIKGLSYILDIPYLGLNGLKIYDGNEKYK